MTTREQFTKGFQDISTILANQVVIKADHDKLGDTLQTVVTKLGVVAATVETLKKDYDDQRHKLFDGNGQPAILPAMQAEIAVIRNEGENTRAMIIPVEVLEQRIETVVSRQLDTHTVKCQAALNEKWNGADRRKPDSSSATADVIKQTGKTRHPFVTFWVATMVPVSLGLILLIVKSVK